MFSYDGDWYFFGNNVGLREWLEFDVVIGMGKVRLREHALMSEPSSRRGVRVANDVISQFEENEPCKNEHGYEDEYDNREAVASGCGERGLHNVGFRKSGE